MPQQQQKNVALRLTTKLVTRLGLNAIATRSVKAIATRANVSASVRHLSDVSSRLPYSSSLWAAAAAAAAAAALIQQRAFLVGNRSNSSRFWYRGSAAQQQTRLTPKPFDYQLFGNILRKTVSDVSKQLKLKCEALPHGGFEPTGRAPKYHQRFFLIVGTEQHLNAQDTRRLFLQLMSKLDEVFARHKQTLNLEIRQYSLHFNGFFSDLRNCDLSHPELIRSLRVQIITLKPEQKLIDAYCDYVITFLNQENHTAELVAHEKPQTSLALNYYLQRFINVYSIAQQIPELKAQCDLSQEQQMLMKELFRLLREQDPKEILYGLENTEPAEIELRLKIRDKLIQPWLAKVYQQVQPKDEEDGVNITTQALYGRTSDEPLATATVSISFYRAVHKIIVESHEKFYGSMYNDTEKQQTEASIRVLTR